MAIRVYLHFHNISNGKECQGFVYKDGKVGVMNGSREFRSIQDAKNYIKRKTRYVQRNQIYRARVFDCGFPVIDEQFPTWTYENISNVLNIGNETSDFVHFVCCRPTTRRAFKEIDSLIKEYYANKNVFHKSSEPNKSDDKTDK